MECPDWSGTQYIIAFKIQPLKQTDITDRTLELIMASRTTQHFIATVYLVIYHAALLFCLLLQHTDSNL